LVVATEQAKQYIVEELTAVTEPSSRRDIHLHFLVSERIHTIKELAEEKHMPFTGEEAEFSDGSWGISFRFMRTTKHQIQPVVFRPCSRASVNAQDSANPVNLELGSRVSL
jgi:hypothetical protein